MFLSKTHIYSPMTHVVSSNHNNLVYSVRFFKMHVYIFISQCHNLNSYVICLNGKLSMASIDKHNKLNRGRPSVIHYGIYSSPGRSSCIENVIYKNHVF